MSLFDVLKHQPIPDPMTQEYLNSIPAEVYLRYRVWIRKEWNYINFSQQVRRNKLLELLEKHDGNQSNRSESA